MNDLIDLQRERVRRLRQKHPEHAYAQTSLGELMGELAAVAAYRALRTHERRHHRPASRRRRVAR